MTHLIALLLKCGLAKRLNSLDLSDGTCLLWSCGDCGIKFDYEGYNYE